MPKTRLAGCTCITDLFVTTGSHERSCQWSIRHLPPYARRFVPAKYESPRATKVIAY